MRLLHLPRAGTRGRRGGRVGVVADDWRVTVTFRDEADVRQAARSVREHEVEDDARSQLGPRIVMSVDGSTAFLYAGTEDTAREADRVVREVLAQHQLSAEFTLDRWHPLEEEWEDVSVPMPDTAEQRAAEHQRLVAAETEDSLTAGQAGWEVRVELPSHRQAVELAERLQAEGRPVIRRWKYLVVGVNNEDDASALAEAIGQEIPAKASVRTLAVPFIYFDDASPQPDEPPAIHGGNGLVLVADRKAWNSPAADQKSAPAVPRCPSASVGCRTQVRGTCHTRIARN